MTSSLLAENHAADRAAMSTDETLWTIVIIVMRRTDWHFRATFWPPMWAENGELLQ